MIAADRSTLREIVVGATCVLVALVSLVTILEMYARRSEACFATSRCHDVAMMGAAIGLLGVILLFHAVATPTRL